MVTIDGPHVYFVITKNFCIWYWLHSEMSKCIYPLTKCQLKQYMEITTNVFGIVSEIFVLKSGRKRVNDGWTIISHIQLSCFACKWFQIATSAIRVSKWVREKRRKAVWIKQKYPRNVVGKVNQQSIYSIFDTNIEHWWNGKITEFC